MWPGVLYFLLAHLVSAHTPAAIYRYPGYSGCDQVNGTVTFHSANGTQLMLLSLGNLPANATGYIQIHNGVNCFDALTLGAIWQQRPSDAFMFEANEQGNATGTIPYGNVTVDSLMGRSVIILLETDNATRRIGCGTVGTSYPASLEAYPGAANGPKGSIAVTGPLTASDISDAAHGATFLQLAFALNSLTPLSNGTIQVFNGSSCRNVSAIGGLYGSNWTSTYNADASGVAVGNADITHVSPARGVVDYYMRTVLINGADGQPIACAVLQCPPGSVEEGQTGGMNMQHGKCVPPSSWISSTVVAGDFYSSQTQPVQVQVSSVGFDLGYGQVRSYPACAQQGNVVGTNFFISRSSDVEGVLAGQFVPVAGNRQIVAFGDKQPESVGRQDNFANVSFIQSVQANTHDIVHLAVGVDAIVFRVAAAGLRSEKTVEPRSHATIPFPTSVNAINTTVWITNAATGSIIYQKEFLFGKYSPNFVWFLYGWDKSAPDCSSGQKNCGNFPLSVTQWPEVREDLGPGVIPPVTQYGSSAVCVPSLFLAIFVVAFF